MNKMTKILVVLLSALSLNVSAFAGELSVTGTAKASYAIGGADKNAGKGLGISNEIGLGASGELDNGWTWNYAIALDPAATTGTANNDDQSLTLTTSYGTVGMFITTGGLSTETGWGIGANGIGNDFASVMTAVYGADISDYHNIQYHLPAGLLPFGGSVKVGYAPNLANTTTTAADFKSAGAQNIETLGHDATHVQVSAAPIDGLSIGADYFETGGANTTGQAPTAGNAYAKYTSGPVTVGYRVGYSDVGLTAKSSAITNYENTAYGVQLALNDQFTVSYSTEKNKKRTRAAIVAGAAGAVKTDVESTTNHIQVAYNIGGATVGITNIDASDSDYTTANDETMTLLTIAMAF
jgi:hypothetical protein